ncbi:MAG: hypothetical protein KJ057_15250, partial [Phycisphaerae bacterium]|nr:hypothetical protein [Phycisphaerae bacterium]
MFRFGRPVIPPHGQSVEHEQVLAPPRPKVASDVDFVRILGSVVPPPLATDFHVSLPVVQNVVPHWQ